MFGSTMGETRTYNPTQVFETFPFPEDAISVHRLDVAGREYYDFRVALMIEYDEGLTEIYNRFHDPDERSNAIGELRRLHAPGSTRQASEVIEAGSRPDATSAERARPNSTPR